MAEFPKVHRYMGKFMQLPQDHVNAFVVELEKSVVVIDTTLAVSSAKELRAKAESFGKPIAAVLLTHGHPDHYTGLAQFADVPRVGSQGCLDFAKAEDVRKAPTATQYLGDDYPKERLFPEDLVKSGETRTYDGVDFTFTDLGPGESDSDGMWTVENDGVKHVFIGDTIALNCHCFFHDGHTLEWQKILEKLKAELDPKSTVLYLGHGESPVGTEAIDWQLGYNNAFLNAVAKLGVIEGEASEEVCQQMIATMKTYLPSEATLFLLDYALAATIADHTKKVSGLVAA